MSIQPLRGTKDLIGSSSSTFRWIDQQAWGVAQKFGFQEISTPIIESTDVFKKTLGDSTDIVNKEMYTFDDRSGDSITLRPEGTAGVARAFISNGLYRQVPARFYYNGPMFRYERPQKGRQRQFHQLGVEVLGVESAAADVETISLASLFLQSLGLEDSIQLELNTIGDLESRQNYRQALVDYFSKYENELSEDSRTRLKTNPLRILDSKNEGDKKLITDAPYFENHLNDKCKDFFAQVTGGLEAIGISYTLNPLLVRGLDYYCHTVFEFTTTALGAQNAVLSGGRYDSLIENMGGKSTPGIGWAAGIERLAMLVEEKQSQEVQKESPICLIPLCEEARQPCLKIAHDLRSQGLYVEMLYSGTNMGKLMKKADKMNASHCILIGSDELAAKEASIKNLKTGDQEKRAIDRLFEYFIQ